MAEIFADGIANIHVTGGLVRFDLMTLQPNLKNENDQPVFNMNQRVIMPLNGFVQAFQMQEQVVGHLLQSGVLAQQSDEQSASPAGGIQA